MNYMKIEKESVISGTGLRTVLWLSGCSHACKGCQNPQTWNPLKGVCFSKKAKQEIFEELSKDHISGITFTGGDPLYENNLQGLLKLINEIRVLFPSKNIWLYTGYTWDEIWRNNDRDFKIRQRIVSSCDVLIDGRYIEELADARYPWAGSRNQNVIDVQKSMKVIKELVIN